MAFSAGSMTYPTVPCSRVATEFTETESRGDVSRGWETGGLEELLLVCGTLEIMAIPEQLYKHD